MVKGASPLGDCGGEKVYLMGEIAPVLPVAVEEQEGRSRPLRGVMQRNISHAAPSKAKQRFAAKSFSFSLPFSLYTKEKEDHFPYRSRHHRATSFTSSSGKGRS